MKLDEMNKLAGELTGSHIDLGENTILKRLDILAEHQIVMRNKMTTMSLKIDELLLVAEKAMKKGGK